MGALLKTVGGSVVAGESSLRVVGASCLWGPFTQGAFDAVGDVLVRSGACPSGRGQSTPSGTGILSPDAPGVPLRSSVHPAARNVPGCRRLEVEWCRQECGRW